MKLITKNIDTHYLYTLKALLEDNGVPAVINGENTARMITPFLTQPGLWIYLDEQEDEAIKLLNDHDYIVKHPVDVDAFYESNKNITNGGPGLNNVLIKLGLWFFSLLAGLFILLRVLMWLST